ncbi:class I SAM-dependent methyltransferase [Micromonospora sp. SCSIO 07396]|uniref:S-adenosyl-L-methionine-dependent methyltransferase n=1 Tax=Micromonospora humidisoli TaxID=2807622 RepID=A0ABS2JB97_9ACTN|nr:MULTISPECIES: SAM-dependent methyltransferase [Micromonospora]MBM7083817.1 SAM-dependent methyltransferase [Micromonospora humidisoli]
MRVEVAATDDDLSGVARTARWTAAARARETARPDRLFDDPYAALLAGADGEALLRHFHTGRAAADGNPVLPIRTRWFDDVLRDSVTEGCQVVGLGAGLDTRAYRLDWPAGTVLFEVDQASVLTYKRRRLARVGTVPRCECRTVATDLTGEWEPALLDAGFDPAARTVWFAEGLLFYLPAARAAAAARQAARLSAAGSRIAVDLIGTGIFRLRYMRPFLDKLARAGSPWRFGTDTPAEFLRQAGWAVERITEPGAAGANYGRWPQGGVPADFPNLPRSYLATAGLPTGRPGPPPDDAPAASGDHR